MESANLANNKFSLSLVIPVYDEEHNIRELHGRLTKVMSGLSVPYQIIFIDDGSKDCSFEMLKDLHGKDRRVEVIKFSRNFGHHIAITAGLDYAQGDAVIIMDGDLQDPPEEIPKLYEKFKEGYDIVYAIRATREDPFHRKTLSLFFYKLFKTFARVDIPASSGIFMIITRRVAETLRNCREKSRFISALISWTGFSSAEVETKRRARHAGKTKYNLRKLIQLALHGVTSFSYFPLRLATYLGFFTATLSFIAGIYIIIQKLFFGFPILGYASIIVSIFFIGGIQLLILGMMGEYIGRVYTESQGRPLYILEEVLK
ncbi:glycosyltransferase family 2 protein [Candidatus Omnitrophota bacterium]